MKNYKKKEILLGESDIATLILAGCGDNGVITHALNFNCDGAYTAYLCDADQEVPSHYEKVWECHTWLKVYDDSELMQTIENMIERKIEVYRAGNYGCLIRLCGD